MCLKETNTSEFPFIKKYKVTGSFWMILQTGNL